MDKFSNVTAEQRSTRETYLIEQFFATFVNTFVSAYSINLVTGSYIAFTKDLELQKFWDITNDWSVTDIYIAKSVHPDDRETMYAATRTACMRERLKDVPSYSVEMRDIAGEKLRYYRCDVRRGIDANHAAVSFTDITREKEEALQLATEKEEVFTLINEFQTSHRSATFRGAFNSEGQLVRLEWSDATEEILGLTQTANPVETYMSWLNNVHPDDYEYVATSLPHDRIIHAENNVIDVSHRFLRRGELIHLRTVTKLLPTMADGSHHFAGFFQDITDDVLFREQQQELLDMQDLANVARWSMDFSLEGEVTSAWYSDACRTILGCTTATDLLNLYVTWVERIHPADREIVLRKFKQAAMDPTDATAYDCEYRFRKNDGSYIHVRSAAKFRRDKKGHPLKAIGIFADVNDTYLKEEKEHQLQLTYEQLQNQMNVIGGLGKLYISVWLVHVPSMEMELYQQSSALANTFNIESVIAHPSYTHALESSAAKVVYPADRELFLSKGACPVVQQALAQNESYRFSFRRVANGQILHTEAWFMKPATDVASADFVIAFRDTEAEFQQEEARRKALKDAFDAAEQANKAKTVFLSSMSHDIRTPMNAIVGFTGLATAHLHNTELVRDYLGKITTSSKHLLNLINDVLDMSRIESGNVKIEAQEVHLPDIFHDLRSIIQGDIVAKGLDLLFDSVDVVNEDIICDRLRLNQVLLNLLSNAVKFTHAGGTVSVKVVQRASARPGYANFAFKVKDTGIGISEEFQKHIFEAFSREQTATVSGIQGTGLGLAITKTIVDMMGGTISVTSELGKGSEFTIEMQLAIVNKASASDASVPRLKDLPVLIVDGNHTTCLSIAKMLRRVGMRSEWTTKGAEALLRAQFALEQQDEFYAYIIEWLLPDMDGIEVVRQIRSIIGESKPIIILTAYDWKDIEAEARAAGVTDFCAKPLFLSDLKAALTRPFRLEVEVEPPASVAADDFTGIKVLLVEDNALNRELAQTILEEYGFLVSTANDGDVAVEMLRKSTVGQYDLVLMDIQMPKMDGYTATREIRTLPQTHSANIPIIAMTANAFDEDRKAAFHAGMNGFITKPIDVDAMLKTMREILP